MQDRSSGRTGRPTRGGLRLVIGLVASAWWVGGCFDSDEIFKVAPAGTSGEPGTTSDNPTTTSTTTVADDTTGEPMGDDRCIDAIDCVRGCILDLAQSNLPEPDLSCFLDCTKTLSEQEALKLLRLGNCISDQCVVTGACENTQGDDTGGGSTDDGGSSESGSSESGSSESSSSTGDDGADDGGLIDPCLLCILNGMLDPEPEGCVDLAESCRSKD